MDIELVSFRTVIAVAEHGSIRRAATALNIRQSTLSRRIRHLEEQLGVDLFERSGGGVRITPAGVGVVRMARGLFAQLDRIVSASRSVGSGESGNITVGFCMSLSASKLRAILAGYVQAFPDVEIQVVERSRSLLLDGIRSGDVDIGIIMGELREHSGPSLSLWSERIVVALSAQHRLANHDVIYWTDLKGESFLLSRRDPGPTLRDIIVQKLSAPGDPPRIAGWDVSNESILAMLETSSSVSVHCESWTDIAYPGVIFREVRETSGPNYITFTACWESDNKNPALARFLELLRKHHHRL